MSPEMSQDKYGERVARTAGENSIFRRMIEQETSREVSLSKLDIGIQQKCRSVPAKEGESYKSVLERMFPSMKESNLEILAHDTAGLNNNKRLAPGDRFEILSDYGKKLLKESILKELNSRNHHNSHENKTRSRFAPAYELPMREFKERILSDLLPDNERKSITSSSEHEGAAKQDGSTKHDGAASKTISEKALLKSRKADQRTDSKTLELHLNDTTDNAADNALSRADDRIEKTQYASKDIFSEQTLSNFVDACHEFAKRSESLLFLSKWYDTDSHMYQWGEKRFNEAFLKSQDSFQKVYQSIHDAEERQRIEEEWKGFLTRQKESLASLKKPFSWNC